MELVLKLRPDVAERVRTGTVEGELAVALLPFGVQPHALHPGRLNGPLSTYFTVVTSSNEARVLQSRLAEVDGVDSVQIQPAPET
jgi:hypothetical protein